MTPVYTNTKKHERNIELFWQWIRHFKKQLEAKHFRGRHE
jgi:hypothetical protein